MMALVLGALRFSLLLAQILFGVWLFSSKLPSRKGGMVAASGIILAFLLYTGLCPFLVYEGGNTLLFQLVLFSTFLIACVVIVRVRREASWLTALFCATAGYTTQNLASGLDGLVKLLALEGWGIPEENMLLWTPSFIACTAAVYVPVYLLFVRRVRMMQIERAQHRGMAAVLAVVFLTVILFDVVNKSLPGFGVPLVVTCTARVIHGVVCSFVLYAEYQMVFNRQIQLEKAATAQMLEERGRQYELSRETIAAINRRVHDIRHQVARTLDGSELDRETLAEVTRSVDVYDASVRTGNEALDTVLTERSLLCGREGVIFTCVADGACLSHLSPAETYSLVGSILDEAVAAARNVADPQMRTISLSIRTVGDMASIHVEAFAEEGWTRADREDSAEVILRRHGGFFSAGTEDGILLIDATLPTS